MFGKMKPDIETYFSKFVSCYKRVTINQFIVYVFNRDERHVKRELSTYSMLK